MAAAAPPWTRSIEQVQKDLQVDVHTGLSASEVSKRQAKHGFNELVKEPATPLWKLVLEQFDDMLVKILLMAAVVSFVLAYFEEGSAEEGLRAYIEPFVILLILILNAIVGVWQESNAEAALEALKELQSDTARVIRGGKHISDLPARELVPGDVIELHTGDKVPADCRIISLRTATLHLEQASLTGESVAVNKVIEPIADAECEIQGQTCMAFAGTAISNGTATAIVTSTGMSTEIGKIQEQIQAAHAEEEETPLKKKLNQFGELLAQVIFYICVAVWLINYHHFLTFELVPGSTWLPRWGSFKFNLGKATYYFKIAVALAVAAIPEGLPAVITTCLALGTRTMAKKNAIVRKLPSVETLGCTTVICSDKTGTLTTNQMSCVQMVALSSDMTPRGWTVLGHTYNPDEGEVVGLKKLDAPLRELAEVAALCNEASIEVKNGVYRAVGAPTEAALKVLVEKLGVPEAQLNATLKSQRMQPDGSAQPVCEYYASRVEQVAELEFDRNRKSMSVIVRPTSGGGSNRLLVKGAAECVLERCNRAMLPDGTITVLTDSARQALLESFERMAAGALRCLALAQKSDLGTLSNYDGTTYHKGHAQLMDLASYATIESGLVFLGMVGLKDPARPEVAPAIRDCRRSGIRVHVITGDNKATAEAICRNIGLFSETADLTGKSFTGRDFVSLPKEQQLSVLRTQRSCVFSRAEPKHKQDIVRLLKELGDVVAMTGDGVNDAPALKLADIGIAMGITGTEVAKEASDMVLADDNFSSIVAAVSEGRAIYNNMKAFIRYMISSNIGEVAAIFLTAALGLPEGLIPVQLLWVNLVTDGPPATALGFNPPDKDIMDKPPRRTDELLITPWLFVRYIIIGTYVGIATVGAFVIWYMYDRFLWIDLSGDGHTLVTWQQLRGWESCPTWDGFTAGPYTAGSTTFTFPNACDYFTYGKAKASTLSLSVIVLVEMFNAMNALSEDLSLLTTPFWSNPYLLLAIIVSTGLHCVILYVPALASIFSIVPLTWPEWQLVLLCSFPVILIDEALKFLGRRRFGSQKVKQE